MALAVAERVYQSTDCVNAIFCGKQPAPTFVTVDDARAELAEGLAAWDWASTAASHEDADLVIATCGDVPTLEALAAVDLLRGHDVKVWFVNVVAAWDWASTAASHEDADLVIATCGDVPTLEALAAVDLLRGHDVKVWFVNVVDLLKIQNACENDRAISDERFAEFFGVGEKPVLFCFHAYAGTIRRLMWARPGHDAWCVHGYEEKGSTTTPFDMLRLNNMDRWALATVMRRRVPPPRRSTCCA